MSDVIGTEGYAPSVPSTVDLEGADAHDLILMIRDTLQNGANPTRGNLALSYLLAGLQLPYPELPLDPAPWVEYTDEAHRASTNIEDGDWVFKPRYGYDQRIGKYRPTMRGYRP